MSLRRPRRPRAGTILSAASLVAAAALLCGPYASGSPLPDEGGGPSAGAPGVPGAPVPEAVPRTQKAQPPTGAFTAKWTRNDVRQIIGRSDTEAVGPRNSLPRSQTMPSIPRDFPRTSPDVWVWDSWPLTDGNGDQVTYRGWDVVFSLTADRRAGYAFDERHQHARIGYFYRKADVPEGRRPADGGWTYGGRLFPDDASLATAEWAGSARYIAGGGIKVFYTAAASGPDSAVIASADGRITAGDAGVRFAGFGRTRHRALLEPDGRYYQTAAQNRSLTFRDPYTFTDPAHPGKTYMVFAGNTAGASGSYRCGAADLGYRPGDPAAEPLAAVRATGANHQVGNVGLAVADDAALTRWHVLPPILSANCVNARTERPQMYIRHGKHYLFTVSHRSAFAGDVTGPDGLYGFVGDDIRSDYQPMNTSGLVMGNPTDLDLAPADPRQNPRQFQASAYYVQPGGYVTSFIDTVDGRRGGDYAPTVRIGLRGASSSVDYSFGNRGLGRYVDIRGNTTRR